MIVSIVVEVVEIVDIDCRSILLLILKQELPSLEDQWCRIVGEGAVLQSGGRRNLSDRTEMQDYMRRNPADSNPHRTYSKSIQSDVGLMRAPARFLSYNTCDLKRTPHPHTTHYYNPPAGYLAIPNIRTSSPATHSLTYSPSAQRAILTYLHLPLT